MKLCPKFFNVDKVDYNYTFRCLSCHRKVTIITPPGVYHYTRRVFIMNIEYRKGKISLFATEKQSSKKPMMAFCFYIIETEIDKFL